MRTRFKSFLKATTIVDVLPLKSIVPSGNPLRTDLGEIAPLIDSIKRRGLLEPILVRPLGSKFEIVAGHRRYFACRMNGVTEIRAIILHISDRDAYEISLEENLQRQTLDPIEEGRAYQRYVDEYGYGSISELARIIGKSEEYVSHRIRLLSLPPEVQGKVRRRLLTSSDAWELSRVRKVDEQKELAEVAVRNAMTVKQLRTAANLLNSGDPLSAVLKNICDNSSGSDGTYDSPKRTSYMNQESRREKLRDAATSILRVAMVRLDNLVEELDSPADPLREKLIVTRLAVHDLVDGFSTKDHRRMEHFSLVKENGDRAQSDEIARFVRDSFVDSLNSRDVKLLEKIRSSEKYSMFDDFPPFRLLNYPASIEHESSLLGTIDGRTYTIRDLKVTTLGSEENVALATFTSEDQLRVKQFSYLFRSRVSLVLERINGRWKIIHEHWSQENPYEDTVDNMKGLEHQLE